ncbi:hypothetical protein AAZX31_14G175500 [Glycine max]
MALSHSEELFDNGGIDCLFETENASAGDSQCQGVAAAEGPYNRGDKIHYSIQCMPFRCGSRTMECWVKKFEFNFDL